MAISRPTFYPQPWASDEAMEALTPDEMAAGYPAGTNDKPSRQSINGVLQFATNGVLYYLIRGVPEWSQAVEYEDRAIVIFSDAYYMALNGNVGLQPDTNTTAWERLPWRRSELNDLYVTNIEADSRFLTLAQADTRYYPRPEANATFLRQADAALQFITQAALDANYITKAEAETLFLTQAQGDARFARIGEVVTQTQLASTLANYITTEEANATFMTTEQANAAFMTQAEANETFLTHADAQANFLALVDAGMTVWRFLAVYPLGALVLDLESGIVYQSLQEGNQGNAVTDTEWWRVWEAEAPPDDTNGMFLHLIEIASTGSALNTHQIDASQIPSLAQHPEGIFLKVILKSHGGNGHGGTGMGAGEGFTHEVMLQNITDAMFPITVTFTDANNDRNVFDDVTFSGASPLTITAQPGNYSGNTPGEGGQSGDVQNSGNHVLYSRGIKGADGRWPVPGIRGGDGGGAHGGSGTANGTAIPAAFYGCGGGGSYGSLYTGNPGYGFCLIYW
jgi:hypothetical protein